MRKKYETLGEELLAASGVTVEAGQSEQELRQAVVEVIRDIPEKEWDALSDGAQAWANVGMRNLELLQQGKNVEFLDFDDVEGVAAALAEQEEAEKAAKEAEKAAKAEKRAAAKAALKSKSDASKAAKVKAGGAKTTKPAVANGSSPGRRTRFQPKAKIKLLSKQNPFREGSYNWTVYGLYKSGMTVEEFEKICVKGEQRSKPRQYLVYHSGKGLISVE